MYREKRFLVKISDIKIRQALKAAEGNVKTAAAALGVGWSTFYRRLKAMRQSEPAKPVKKSPLKKKAAAKKSGLAKVSKAAKDTIRAVMPVKKAPLKKKAAATKKTAVKKKKAAAPVKKKKSRFSR